jgi:4-amino-4-deoxy-L-arabinose transferase-like glycosyltransferase
MKKIFIILILVLAAFLRFYQIADFPAGLNADEAALGYNAYSLMLTGKDEHGHPWPINLESFGDFKPALYSYILIPSVKVFGLTELAVRLPSAIFGFLSVLFIYLLAKEIFPDRQGLPEISALILAISPWALHFSRGGWEVNVATTFILIGVYSFVIWLRRSTLPWLISSVTFFILSMYTYQSARLIAPILGLYLVLTFVKNLLRVPRQVVLAAILGLVLFIPLANSVLRSDAASRFSGVGLLADEGPVNRVKELRGQHRPGKMTVILDKIFHTRPVIYTIQFVKNYTDHFNGDFLFINGDSIPRNKVPETGQLYLTDFLLLGIGIIYLLRHPSARSRIIWIWLFIAPIASASTFQTPHALRAENMVIPLSLIVSFGVYAAVSSRIAKVVIPVLVVLYAYQFTRYLHEYYVHYPQTYPYAWQYGFKELVPYVQANQSRYDKILVTDKYDQPYILFLFYSQYPPILFQDHHTLTFRDQYNFSTVRDYDKYHFASTPWDKVRDIHSALIVAAPEDIPAVGVNIVKTINFPDGSPAFKIISN